MSRATQFILTALMVLVTIPAMYAFGGTLTAQSGFAYPLTDLNDEIILKGAWGLSYDAWLKDNLALGLNPYFTNILARDGADSFESTLEGVDVYLKIRPTKFLSLNYGEGGFINRISPFAAIGIGGAHYGTEGTIAGAYFRRNKYMAVLPNAAVGVSLITNSAFNFDLGVKLDYTNSDRIDNVNTSDWKDAYLMPYVGIALNFTSPDEKDSDRDGIPDYRDQAPKNPEDFDGFMDADGAPDPDNDGDGILDVNDGAPLQAEDIDGFKDFDGIPDLDNDNDTILDVNDQAPNVPEDFDGYLDTDGIPDTDNDKDGILDATDRAPNDAEDKDSFEDNDGIPDLDNDKDAIADILDQAPGTDETIRKGIDTKETYNDYQDTDGVPDVKPEQPKNLDKDGDGILDANDGAPNDAEDFDGFMDSDGIPDLDNDGDGILDKKDGAPNDAEDKDNYQDTDGIPDLDNDNDGVLDVNDKAPNDAEDKDNFMDFDGVPDPDNDNDRIPDTKDKAPGTDETLRRGIDTMETYNGFQDEDGVPDVKPEEPKNLDQDGDGILDVNDGAPSDAEDFDGYKDNDGIPDLDNDGDGILDKNDGAPNDTEDIDAYMDTDGIPDLDNDADRIPDVKDKAPGTDQTVLNQIDTKETYNDFEDEDGVPDTKPAAVVPVEEQELQEALFTHVVHFATSLYTIPEADKVFLNKVADSMKKLPKVRIQIQGHTDNTGNDAINIPLSLNRAKVVRDYLLSRGVESSRMEVKGFSKDKPIASNDTVEGRGQNRRADIIIIK